MPARSKRLAQLSAAGGPVSSSQTGSSVSTTGGTREPRRATPVWATDSGYCSVTGRLSVSGSVPPAASSRSRWDLPVPLNPSAATRSPNQISASTGQAGHDRVDPVKEP